jgi:hypothetical protein
VKTIATEFLFPEAVEPPLEMLVKQLRSEAEYDMDTAAELTALHAIAGLRDTCSAQSWFLVYAEPKIAVRSALRSKRGLLVGEKKVLSELQHCTFEAECGGNKTRLGAVLNLSSFYFKNSAGVILNYIDACFIVTSLNIQDVCKLAENWLEISESAVLGLSYARMAEDIRQGENFAIVRYFYADNTKPEILVAVGQRNFLDLCVRRAVSKMIV